jgi:hypothetical protein
VCLRRRHISLVSTASMTQTAADRTQYIDTQQVLSRWWAKPFTTHALWPRSCCDVELTSHSWSHLSLLLWSHNPCSANFNHLQPKPTRHLVNASKCKWCTPGCMIGQGSASRRGFKNTAVWSGTWLPSIRGRILQASSEYKREVTGSSGMLVPIN